MKTKVLQELEQFIAIESVSTDPKRASEVVKAAKFLTNKLHSLGFSVNTIGTQGPPLLIAERVISGNTKTIGIYGHYDVQPEDPVESWHTKPFKLTLRLGKMWGRGIADDKGHVWQSIAALEELISHNTLSHNIVFLLEGEEEVGSVNLENYLKESTKVLSGVDAFYITDVGMHGKNMPQIFYALRGIVYFEIEITIGDRDLHSGVYGNSVYNPIQLLAELFGKIKNSTTGRILIPHFYDTVRDLSPKELQLLEQTGESENLSSKILPSFDPNGIIGGYTGPGSKTIIPATASAKFSLRLVENQNPDEVEQMVREFVQKNIPSGVEYKLTLNSKDAPFYTNYENEYVRRTATILREVFGHEVIFNRSGGSIPAAEKLQRLFKKPIILTGFTLPDENLHSPNENFDEEMFWKGIEALKKMYGSRF